MAKASKKKKTAKKAAAVGNIGRARLGANYRAQLQKIVFSTSNPPDNGIQDKAGEESRSES